MTSPRWLYTLTVLLVCIVAAVFLPGLSGGFVFDDAPNIISNENIHINTLDAESIYRAAFSPQPGGLTRILPTISFAIDYWRGGLDPNVFKTTNIAIHIITTLALAWLFRQLFIISGFTRNRATLLAVLSAFAWAVHPIQVSSVLYVVQRMQTMSTMILVLALSSYLSARQAQINNQNSRTHWMLTFFLWLLSIACKEDAILLPAYTLAIELTLLKFSTSDAGTSLKLKRIYKLATIIGVCLYLFIIIPHFWEWGAYQGRNFSTAERLFTQARVLCMYLWELLVPMPSHMPFYYDWLTPSKDILHPWTTITSIAVVAGLLFLAWYTRHRRPLFALGVMIFFSAHFITSNVVGLELAFEHRNHFALIGVVLALGDLLTIIAQRLKLNPALTASLIATALLSMSCTTALRAKIWGNPMTLARTSTENAPNSSRAWNSLCLLNYELSEQKPGPFLDRAIDACTQGSAIPTALSPMTNLIIFKTIRGDITQSDWGRLQDRLRHVVLTPENTMALWVILNDERKQHPLDPAEVLKAIEIVTHRTTLRPVEYTAIGYYLLDTAHNPELAFHYFNLAISNLPPHSGFTIALLSDLKSKGQPTIADRLRANITSNPPPNNIGVDSQGTDKH